HLAISSTHLPLRNHRHKHRSRVHVSRFQFRYHFRAYNAEGGLDRKRSGSICRELGVLHRRCQCPATNEMVRPVHRSRPQGEYTLKVRKYFWPVVGVAAVAFSIWLLYHELRGLSLDELWGSLVAIPARDWILAAAATLLAYAA